MATTPGNSHLPKQDAIENASSINDCELIPIMAMTYYNQYGEDDKEAFYDECIEYITEHGDTLITDGDTFECVCLDEEADDSDECYYIYNPMFEFDQ